MLCIKHSAVPGNFWLNTKFKCKFSVKFCCCQFCSCSGKFGVSFNVMLSTNLMDAGASDLTFEGHDGNLCGSISARSHDHDTRIDCCKHDLSKSIYPLLVEYIGMIGSFSHISCTKWHWLELTLRLFFSLEERGCVLVVYICWGDARLLLT